MVKKKRVKPDVVLIMTAGKIGESGELQAVFDKLGVPFTFSGVEETRYTDVTTDHHQQNLIEIQNMA